MQEIVEPSADLSTPIFGEHRRPFSSACTYLNHLLNYIVRRAVFAVRARSLFDPSFERRCLESARESH
jgi:hypothetical protein